MEYGVRDILHTAAARHQYVHSTNCFSQSRSDREWMFLAEGRSEIGGLGMYDLALAQVCLDEDLASCGVTTMVLKRAPWSAREVATAGLEYTLVADDSHLASLGSRTPWFRIV